jgi:predicted Zn-dependent protease
MKVGRLALFVFLVSLTAPFDVVTTTALAGVQDKDKDKDKKDSKDTKQAEELKKYNAELQASADAESVRVRSKYYVGDEFLQNYVNELGQSLVPKDAPADLYFSFRVLDEVSPNAFALPDGRIFIHAGLISFVDNEAQLAMVLGHEIGHVLKKHAAKALQNSRSFKTSLLGGLVGAATSGLTGSKDAGQAAAATYAMSVANSYGRDMEDEADQVGIRLVLARRIDPSASVGFFEKLTKAFGEDDRLSNLLWGSHPRNVARIESIKRTLDGEMKEEYTKLKGAGELSVDSGRFQLKASRLIRETAIEWVRMDRYDIAKANLDRIQDIRNHDPKTLWYLGRVYKLIARTDGDKNKALDFFQRAQAADQRNLYPEIQRDYAFMLAERTGGAGTAQAVELLKRYVMVYVQSTGAHPPDLESIYDYLLLFGDGAWTAPKVDRRIVAERAPETRP